MSIFAPAAPPKSELARYRVLSSTCGLRVSPLCLGGMSFGQSWSSMLGSMTKEQTFELLDTFYAEGGNFIDTANNYQEGESEEWIGEWMAKRKNRDEMVIATKYTATYKEDKNIKVNYYGNHAKSLHTSIASSLKRLGTDYIDILYVHFWDYTSSVEEVMQSLNNLVRSGKVLYLGISDTPAWVVADCNRYAKSFGLAQFVIYQGQWNIMLRDFEREIIPMARAQGMALAPWGAMGQGKFQSEADMEERKKSGESLRPMRGPNQSPEQVKMSQALAKVAAEHSTTSVTAVALAYVMQKTPYVFPIVGGRKVEHLKANIEAITLVLTPAQITYLESIFSFDLGFPLTMIGQDPATVGGKVSALAGHAANWAFVEAPKAITISKAGQ